MKIRAADNTQKKLLPNENRLIFGFFIKSQLEKSDICTSN